MKTTQQISDQAWEEALQDEVTLSKYYATQDIIQEQMYQLNKNN